MKARHWTFWDSSVHFQSSSCVHKIHMFPLMCRVSIAAYYLSYVMHISENVEKRTLFSVNICSSSVVCYFASVIGLDANLRRMQIHCTKAEHLRHRTLKSKIHFNIPLALHISKRVWNENYPRSPFLALYTPKKLLSLMYLYRLYEASFQNSKLYFWLI
jgi:hypothetical protein